MRLCAYAPMRYPREHVQYACEYRGACACIYADMRVPVRVSMHVRMRLCVRARVGVRVLGHACADACACAYAPMSLYTQLQAPMRLCAYAVSA